MRKQIEISSIEGNQDKVSEGGKLIIDYYKQIMKIKLKNWRKTRQITCNEGYHLWRLLDSVFQSGLITKRLKVYNSFGEEINLKGTLRRTKHKKA